MPYTDNPTIAVPQPLPSDLQHKIDGPDDKWSDTYAKGVVVSDFAYAEAYRTAAHDWRYRNADELYLGWAGQRYWEGTRVPRSSLGIYAVFEQVESILPQIVSAVLNEDSYQFEDEYGEASDTALAWRKLLIDQLYESDFREQGRRALKSAGIYGNGILEVGIENYYEEFVNFEKQQRPGQLATVSHPLIGPVSVPVGPPKITFKRSISKEKKLRPYVRYVSVKDAYVDPNNESTRIQDGGHFIKRQYMRAEQVKALRSLPNFKIPDDEILTKMSMAKVTANQDVTKQAAELFRYNLWNPALDYTSDPAQKRMEVIEYTTRDRKVWMLGREYVIYNQPNLYGFINYFSCNYADVLDRWHALAISDVAEGEQRLQQAIINARIDELALSIHRPMAKRRGVTIPAYQLKMRPGLVIETEAPDTDIKQLDVQNITQQAFIEVDASRLRVQRMTGVTDLTGSGTPAPAGNSAARTATGVNTQAQASGGRMKYHVENAESQLIEPVLNALVKINKKFMDPQQAANWLMLDPQFQKLDPAGVMNARVRVTCRGAAKMAARTGFLQVFPLLAQTYLNPELLQMLAQQQKKTVSIKALADMLLDAISYSPKSPLIIDLSPEQIQQMQAPPPEAVMKMQLQGQQDQTQQGIAQDRMKTDLIKTMMKTGMDTHAKLAKLDDEHNQFLMGLANEQENAPGGGGGEGGAGED